MGALDIVAQVACSGGQTINAAASAAIAFDVADDLDYQAVHSPTSNNTRLTAPMPGIYEVTAQLAVTGSAAGSFTVTLRKNGSGGTASGAYISLVLPSKRSHSSGLLRWMRTITLNSLWHPQRATTPLPPRHGRKLNG